MSHFFKRKVCKELEEFFTIDELKSKKWSEQRFNNALEKMKCQGELEYKFQTKSKLEPMGTDTTPAADERGGRAPKPAMGLRSSRPSSLWALRVCDAEPRVAAEGAHEAAGESRGWFHVLLRASEF